MANTTTYQIKVSLISPPVLLQSYRAKERVGRITVWTTNVRKVS